MRSTGWVLCVVTLVSAACSSGGSTSKPPSASTPSTATAIKVEPPGTGGCDPVDPNACLLPFPNDRFTPADPSTPTGRRLDLPVDGMPANKAGKHIDPTEWNRNDGFSPSSIGLIVVPNLDVAASNLPPQTNIARSLEPQSPVVVVDVDTGQRVAAWAEIDPRVTDPAHRLLRIVPAVGLAEGHRIAIGLRGLKHTDGTDVTANAAVVQLVARSFDRAEPVARRPGRRRCSARAASWPRGRSRSHRNKGSRVGCAACGNRPRALSAPARRSSSSPPPTTRARRGVVRGTFEMPRYLTGTGGPGSVFDNVGDPNGIPRRNGTMNDDFVCTVPKNVKARSAPFVLYGHGLLGSRDEVLGIGGVGASAGIGFCALDELGMSAADIPTVLGELADLSKFRTQADRLQQGQLGFLELGRLLASTQGFGSNKEFQTATGASIIDAAKLTLLGASQGGILGGVVSALTKDWNRVILAVGGMGYNLLLRRSVDFDEFAGPLEAAYPNRVDQALALELMEQLWDRGENTGYAEHLVGSPYPEAGGAKTVMMLEAFGDHQVTNVATEKLAARRWALVAARPRSRPVARPTSRRTSGSIRSRRCRTRARAWSSGTSARRPRPRRSCPTARAPTRTGNCPTCPRRSRSSPRS